MSARILVVDDIPANVKFLEARLGAEYFDVIVASNGPDALALCAQGRCDVVVLDVMMPGMDGFEVCRRLKADPTTAHLPVVMVTALDQPADRVRGLEAGADDFLTKPVDELALIARVRSLARLKMAHDELRGRALTAIGLGLPSAFDVIASDRGEQGKVLIVDDRPSSYERIAAALSRTQKVTVEPHPAEAVFKAAEGGYDLILISLGFQDHDALRLAGQLRSLERTRQTPLLLIAEPEDRNRLLRGLDLGVNDYLTRPVDRNELVARVRTQIRRKRVADILRENVQATMEAAVFDALTGLHNRRYFDSHFAALVAQAAAAGKPLSLMALDIDHFKKVNDSHGHGVGDDVLRGFAARVKAAIRSADLMCRLGGEEFVVVMPDTTPETARRIAERVRQVTEQAPFPAQGGAFGVPITVSIGVADRGEAREAAAILASADKALYRSKANGRNRVTADAA
ncbi:MAG: PleD family two-component system response regulator [Methylobacteriaceae bacterium]|nr:PleD family two-component system response regulator [Methylobacteriaceae bacterium]